MLINNRWSHKWAECRRTWSKSKHQKLPCNQCPQIRLRFSTGANMESERTCATFDLSNLEGRHACSSFACCFPWINSQFIGGSTSSAPPFATTGDEDFFPFSFLGCLKKPAHKEKGRLIHFEWCFFPATKEKEKCYIVFIKPLLIVVWERIIWFSTSDDAMMKRRKKTSKSLVCFRSSPVSTLAWNLIWWAHSYENNLSLLYQWFKQSERENKGALAERYVLLNNW